MKLKNFFRIAAISFLAVAIASCDKKKHSSDDEDEDEDIRSTEKVEKRDTNDGPAYSDYSDASSNVETFCNTVKAAADRISYASSMNEVSSIAENFGEALDNYKYDTASFTAHDRELIVDALIEYLGNGIDKKVELENLNYSEDELTSVGVNLGLQIYQIVEESDNFKQLYQNLDKLDIDM